MEILKSIKENGARLTLGDRWLVWDVDSFFVYERKKYKKQTSILIKTTDESLAIEKLIGENQDEN